jgi:hypothetical protein
MRDRYVMEALGVRAGDIEVLSHRPWTAPSNTVTMTLTSSALVAELTFVADCGEVWDFCSEQEGGLDQ